MVNISILLCGLAYGFREQKLTLPKHKQYFAKNVIW